MRVLPPATAGVLCLSACCCCRLPRCRLLCLPPLLCSRPGTPSQHPPDRCSHRRNARCRKWEGADRKGHAARHAARRTPRQEKSKGHPEQGLQQRRSAATCTAPGEARLQRNPTPVARLPGVHWTRQAQGSDINACGVHPPPPVLWHRRLLSRTKGEEEDAAPHGVLRKWAQQVLLGRRGRAHPRVPDPGRGPPCRWPTCARACPPLTHPSLRCMQFPHQVLLLCATTRALTRTLTRSRVRLCSSSSWTRQSPHSRTLRQAGRGACQLRARGTQRPPSDPRTPRRCTRHRRDLTGNRAWRPVQAQQQAPRTRACHDPGSTPGNTLEKHARTAAAAAGA